MLASNQASPVRDRLAAGDDPSLTVTLLGGYVDEGRQVHADAEVVSLTGRDEVALGQLPADTPVARVVTALLARCVRRIGARTDVTAELVRDLLVGDRDYLVIRLREATLGPRAWLRLECPIPACGRPSELKVDLRTLPFEPRPASTRFFGEGGPLRFRLPTGADQEAVAPLVVVDAERAAQALFARCVRAADTGAPPDIAGEAAEAVEVQMRALAPEVGLELEAVCPECGVAFSTVLDLVPRMLAELRAEAAGLEQEVHVIAWHYHWSEREILSLPVAKRRRYVALIGRQLDGEAWA